MKKLAPTIIAIRLHKHIIFKSPEAVQLFVDAAHQMIH